MKLLNLNDTELKQTYISNKIDICFSSFKFSRIDQDPLTDILLTSKQPQTQRYGALLKSEKWS